MKKIIILYLFFICLFITEYKIQAQETDRFLTLKNKFHLKPPKINNNIQFNLWLGRTQLLSLSIDTIADSCNSVNAVLYNYSSKYKFNKLKGDYVFKKYVFNKIELDTIKGLVDTINKYKFWNICFNNFDGNNYNYLIKDGCSYYIEVIGRRNQESINLPNLFLQNNTIKQIQDVQKSIYSILCKIDLDKFFLAFLNNLSPGYYTINSTTKSSLPSNLSKIYGNGECINNF